MTDEQELFNHAERLMLEATPQGDRVVHVTAREPASRVKARLGGGLTVLEAKARSRLHSFPSMRHSSQAKTGAKRIGWPVPWLRR